MLAHGVGHACKIEGKTDSVLYTQVLNDEFMKTLEFYDLEVNDIIFQPDNDPKNTSKRLQIG